MLKGKLLLRKKNSYFLRKKNNFLALSPHSTWCLPKSVFYLVTSKYSDLGQIQGLTKGGSDKRLAKVEAHRGSRGMLPRKIFNVRPLKCVFRGNFKWFKCSKARVSE